MEDLVEGTGGRHQNQVKRLGGRITLGRRPRHPQQIDGLLNHRRLRRGLPARNCRKGPATRPWRAPWSTVGTGRRCQVGSLSSVSRDPDHDPDSLDGRRADRLCHHVTPVAGSAVHPNHSDVVDPVPQGGTGTDVITAVPRQQHLRCTTAPDRSLSFHVVGPTQLRVVDPTPMPLPGRPGTLDAQGDHVARLPGRHGKPWW